MAISENTQKNISEGITYGGFAIFIMMLMFFSTERKKMAEEAAKKNQCDSCQVIQKAK